jgi:hypothetical protein
VKRYIFIFFLLIALNNAKSQAITLTIVNGSFITSIDTVYLRLQGNLYQLGGVTSKSYSLSGAILSATVNGCSTGLSTITPVDEIIKILPLIQGTYKIKVKLVEYDNFVYPGCNVVKASTGDSLNINVVSYTGINENQKAFNVFHFYPNPTKNKILIDAEGLDLENSKVNIYNSIGQCVFSITDLKSKQEINVTSLPTGLFYLQFQKGSYQKTSKLFKE